jgi:diguanylate cyclase (GGDEF)-like protein
MSIFTRFGVGGDRAGHLFLLIPVGAAAVWFGSGDAVRSATIVVAALAAFLDLAWARRLRARVEESRHQALTDDLTGLGNRRSLLIDLERAIEQGTDHSPSVLAMFDLDGFKSYNDTYGHPAGDTLLARLGARLAAAFTESGSAYRLGGDEFCLLARGSPAELETAIGQALAALSEEDDEIHSSCGFVLLPREARDASSALRIVDQRMYLQKDDHRTSAKRQARDLLLAVLDQHAPELRPHCDWVGDLAQSVAEQLGLDQDEIDDIALAADLHDIGKIVIPRSILHKPGPLDASEWEMIRRHTVIGETILNGAPVLAGIAALVRSTHERVDGDGYPDGLVGDAIPLGSRIIAVCDAFDAMTSDRSYHNAIPREAAIAELETDAGTQFDRRVVAAARTVLEHPGARRPAANRLAVPRTPDLSPSARIQALLDVIRLVRVDGDPDRLLDEIVETVGRGLGLETVIINMYRPEWDDFIVSSVHGNDRARSELLNSTYPREWFDPLMADRYLRRGAYVIEQGTFDWRTYLGPRYLPSGPPSSIPNAWQREDELFVPFRHSDGHILGLFSVGDPVSGRRLSDEELDVLVAVTSQAAVLVEAAQTSAAWERSQKGLAELLAVSARLLEPGSVQDVLDRVCAGVRSALGFDKVQIQLYDAATATYRNCAALGWPAGDKALTTPTGEADLLRLLDSEFETDGCFLLPYAAGVARCSQASTGYVSQFNGIGPNAWNHHFLLVPLRGPENSVIGVIWVDDPLDRLLPIPRRLQALRLFANQATSALATAKLLERVMPDRGSVDVAA